MRRRKVTTVAAMAMAAAGLVPAWRNEVAARVVHGSRFADSALKIPGKTFDWARSAVVLGLLPDAAADRVSALRYGDHEWYGPKDGESWNEPFWWETAFMDRYLPNEPSRVLIGGAGAGREAYHVASRGHQVVACDPIREFVETMARSMPTNLHVHPYRARYQDLPHLQPATPNHAAANLTDMPPFDVAIFGWSSFSHILHESACIDALQLVARHVEGPILISFFSRDPAGDAHWASRIQRRLPGRNSDPTYAFRMYSGIFRTYTAAEIFELCARAGVSVIEARVRPSFSPSSYVIVQGQAGKTSA